MRQLCAVEQNQGIFLFPLFVCDVDGGVTDISLSEVAGIHHRGREAYTRKIMAALPKDLGSGFHTR